MKKMKHVILPLVCIGFAIASIHVMAQPTCIPIDQKVDLNERYKINLSRDYIKTADAGREQEINFAYHFRYSIDQSMNVIKEGLDSLLMRTLIKDVYEKMILDNIRNMQQCKDGSCITALKIRYGMKNGRVVFLYQPVYLTPIKCSSSICNLQLRYINKADFYKYDAKTESFALANKDVVKADTITYDDYIRVKQHRGSTKFEPMDRRTSWLGDSRSIVFSFQEILEVYHQNYFRETDGDRYCEKLIIHNAAAFYEKGTWISDAFRRGRIKHTSFISSNDWNEDQSKKLILISQTTIVNGNVGNLAHLCPPSCNELSYPIQSQ